MSSGTNILLESGTNEVEMLEFILGGQSFGINVSKVTSIIQFEDELLTAIPDMPPSIMGAFMFRGETISLINLAEALHRKPDAENDRPLVIATEFNNFQCGLYVNGVERIHRVSWEAFVPIENSFSSETMQGSILGTIHINQKDVLIIDIESIATQLFEGLSMESNYQHDSAEIGQNKHRNDIHVILAEDSAFIRKHILGVLNEAGYTNVTTFDNGLSADEYIIGLKKENKRPDAVVSDIEMPKMDGLTLCRKIKTDYNMGDLPVVMFSSLINDQMRHKCESVGANASITKPQIAGLVKLLDEFCNVQHYDDLEVAE